MMDSIEDLFDQITEQSTSAALVTFREDMIIDDETGATFHYSGDPFQIVGMLDAMRVRILKDLGKQYKDLQ